MSFAHIAVAWIGSPSYYTQDKTRDNACHHHQNKQKRVRALERRNILVLTKREYEGCTYVWWGRSILLDHEQSAATLPAKPNDTGAGACSSSLFFFPVSHTCMTRWVLPLRSINVSSAASGSARIYYSTYLPPVAGSCWQTGQKSNICKGRFCFPSCVWIQKS